jgi:hypothetical protein
MDFCTNQIYNFSVCWKQSTINDDQFCHKIIQSMRSWRKLKKKKKIFQWSIMIIYLLLRVVPLTFSYAIKKKKERQVKPRYYTS